MQNPNNKPPFYKPSTKATPLVESNEDEINGNLYRFIDTLENRSNAHWKSKLLPI